MRAGGLAGLALAMAMLLLPGPVETAREAATDALMRAVPRPADGAPPVLAVAAAEADLEALGPWPWPRERWAGLVTRLAEAGAAAIALDIAFIAPAAGDAALTEAVAAAPVVLGVVAGTGAAPPGFGIGGAGAPGARRPAGPARAGATRRSPARRPGHWPFPGAPIRAVPLLLRIEPGEALLPGLALGALARALGRPRWCCATRAPHRTSRARCAQPATRRSWALPLPWTGCCGCIRRHRQRACR